MLKEGSIKVHDSIFHYLLKVNNEPSQFGIDGGKVDKLMIECNGDTVCDYYRGWEIEPTDADTQTALELLLHSHNY